MSSQVIATGGDLSNTLNAGSDELYDKCCSPCLEDGMVKEAEKRCLDCKMYYCEQCLKCHNRIPSTQGHRITNKSGPDNESAQKACASHGKCMDMYCTHHETACCRLCIAENHRTCVNVIYLPDFLSGIKERDEYKETKGKFRIVKSKLEEAQVRRLEDLSSLEQDSQSILAVINLEEEELKKRISTVAELSREKLRVMHANARHGIEQDIIKVQTIIKSITSKEEIFSNGSEAEIFEQLHSGKIALKDGQRMLSALSKQSKRTILNFIS